ncbi:MAG: uroporphyrinogen decarboxylase family protein [Chloroflexota bacterium]
MDIRERITCALKWEEPDQVPVTIYDSMLPRGANERWLRDAGVGLIAALPVHKVEHRQVEFIDREYWQDGRRLIRRTMRTPVGEVWQTLDPDGPYDTGIPWITEHFIKAAEDYKVVEFVVRDAVYHDNYAWIREVDRRLGGDGMVMLAPYRMPIQEMLYRLIGMEQFSYDFHFQRDLIDSLHDVMATRNDEIIDLAAEAPVEIVRLGDNITCDVIGKERFERYCLPTYEKVHKRLAGTGKVLGSHMDGRLLGLKKPIAEAHLDFIEAFTPPPVGDLSVAEARQAWPDKVLWLNFTSSYVPETPAAIEEHTRQLMTEAGSKRGFVMGITENSQAPELEQCLSVITRVLRDW